MGLLSIFSKKKHKKRPLTQTELLEKFSTKDMPKAYENSTYQGLNSISDEEFSEKSKGMYNSCPKCYNLIPSAQIKEHVENCDAKPATYGVWR